ncbi:leucine-rich repeat-containing protein 59 [Macrosteles quadrilineatus]|uniref:leucine-rich repeat-containing protein 59 n=1 Tax=Macrosteles quadrilineatus TaxID=74068 RepID=UPI0023E2112C|nr:leucine-rich repeat-containing protein 59 [Macrosteles quadrilineatus]
MAPKKNLMENFDDGILDLSLSGIQEVPVRDIAAIPKVSSLDLSCNIIVSLPKSFASSLTQLVKLDLSQNQLTALPDNFGLLVNLKHLDLDNNKLESLPLSFGNLKSLRWLDLKHNPLMPKLAQIAGQCLDAQQCHAAARNVVAALRNTQEQVNTEITRRKEQQKKKVEEETHVEDNMKNQNKENHQSKKKKKKGGQATNNTATNHANGQTHAINDLENLSKGDTVILPKVPTNKTVSKPGFFRILGRLLRTTVTVFLSCVLLGVFLGYVLKTLDEQLYNSLRKKVVEVIEANFSNEQLRQWEIGLIKSRRAVESLSSQAVGISIHYFHKSQQLAADISSNETVQQYLEGIKSGWHILLVWLGDTYTDLSVVIPQYYDSVKKLISESTSKAS